MANDPKHPLLNPILALHMEPHPKPSRGGGKSDANVQYKRLAQQKAVLSQAALDLYDQRNSLPIFGGWTHLVAKMFAEDSLAPSYTPTDLFGPIHGCRIVAPLKHGYLIEAKVEWLPKLAHAIKNPTSASQRCDISRVQSLSSFGQKERLRQHSLDELWNAAPEKGKGRQFFLWLAPYQNAAAQAGLIEKLEALATEQIILPTFPATQLLGEITDAGTEVTAAPSRSSIVRATDSYRNTGIGSAAIMAPNKEALSKLVASGVSHRIDPVRSIKATAPGEGVEPTPPTNITGEPIVGVVDGGLHAPSYKSAEAWRVVPLIPDAEADRRHGNAVSSLVVQGYAWNHNRPLPQLDCQIGTVQAVPHGNVSIGDHELIEYLAAVMHEHPETSVWNISANQDISTYDNDEVSALGYGLNELARAANILPVVSIGNGKNSQTRPNPPADCDAAIVVGGRRADPKGYPSGGCPSCLQGPGPDGMLKPDVSWFSELRMIGGVVATGSSYATAITSSLAAHTYANLKSPSPDMVKALLISNCELSEHDPRLGWGTPYDDILPWFCKPGTVILAWNAQIRPGAYYYWNDIPIPPELIRNGKLYGCASLTAILNPLISPFSGANYFASRLQTSLQYRNSKGWGNLLGSMQESSLPEHDSREYLKKWNPVRHHFRDFSKRAGIGFMGDRFRLCARVYTRDLYQFGWNHHSEAGPQEVAFVLSLSAPDKEGESLYNSIVQKLGNLVESAVANQEIDISNQ